MSALLPRPGHGASLSNVRYGQTISARATAKWLHPWCVRTAWNAVTKQWVATVKPGFVNGRCPVWRTSIKEQGLDFGTNPLTGKPYFSDPIFATETAAASRPIDIPLYLEPGIPLNFRGVGFDGAAQFPVPQFFRNRGVASAPESASIDNILAGNTGGEAPPEGLRLLRACDLWVHQPRLALTSEITTGPGPVTGISNVTQTIGLRSATAGDALRVLVGNFSPATAAAGIDPLAGVYEEPNFDEIRIATVYLLSPPNTPSHSEPDGTWQPFVAHNLFWNLQHVVPWFRAYGGDPSVPFLPPLAFGVAQLVVNYLVASVNDILRDALNLVTANSMAGTFYTATGGGHSAKMPTAPATAETGGLNKSARLQNQRLAAARAKLAARLEPEFPYQAEPFDTALLTQAV